VGKGLFIYPAKFKREKYNEKADSQGLFDAGGGAVFEHYCAGA
jgi:hypothetical protein